MAVFFLRTKRTEGMASVYTRVKKRNPMIKWEYVNTGIVVDIANWNKANKSIATWNRFIHEDGKELAEKLEKVSQTIELLFDEKKITSNKDKPILENALSIIANNDALKVREEMYERKRRQKEIKKEEEIRKRKEILSFYDYFIAGISDGTIRHGNNDIYKKSTVQIWKNFGKHLRAYCPVGMSFDEISKQFADKFSVYLEEKGFMAKTVNKYVICFRKLCNLAAEEGINNSAVSLKV